MSRSIVECDSDLSLNMLYLFLFDQGLLCYFLNHRYNRQECEAIKRYLGCIRERQGNLWRVLVFKKKYCSRSYLYLINHGYWRKEGVFCTLIKCFSSGFFKKPLSCPFILPSTLPISLWPTAILCLVNSRSVTSAAGPDTWPKAATSKK